MTLKEARENAGYTQLEAGVACGYKPIKTWELADGTVGYGCPAMSIIESGRSALTARDFLTLCRLYHVDPFDVDLPPLARKARGRKRRNA